MKLAENIESPFTGDALVTHTEQPALVREVDEKDTTMGFFVIGGVINIVMILAYFVWAFRQWKRIDKRNR